ncbi:Carboxylesterase family [Popillia japonica]|uniref:Carboxylic ester hydrolase n=1 Tax=Popillia japonica TaxID=7064 RepID=A0AAW1L9P3_POPJA
MYCVYIGAQEKDSLLEVRTNHGWVLGKKLTNSVYAWNGIPYAKPPLGDLRFEAPVAPNNWTGIWDATYDRSECVSFIVSELAENINNPRGDEDCLYVNVYTPKPPQSIHTPLAVMVWIHGGSFLHGNGSYALYSPTELVREGVIVVSFNYRLGIFGFLSTNDNAVPGNTGLRDQLFALNWVQNNIRTFGGNPNQVTIFGESAGAASVSYLVLSPLSRGLFSRAIMESGTALCIWSLSKKASEAAFAVGAIMESGTALCIWSLSKKASEAAFAVGATLGINTTSSTDLVRALKNVSAKDLHRAAILIMGTILARSPIDGLVYAPVMEPPGDNAVVTISSYERLHYGAFNRVTQIMGYNSAEFYLFQNLVGLILKYLANYNLTSAHLVPSSMRARKSNLPTIGDQIKAYYGDNDETVLFPKSRLLNYLSDTAFVRPIQKTVQLTSKYAMTYFYKFSYNSIAGALGAGHADELKYIFDNENDISVDEKNVAKCMKKLWTNFAKYGNPSYRLGSRICNGIFWKPMTPSDRRKLYYINIDKVVTRGSNPDGENMTFWNNLFEKYALGPLQLY